MEKIALIDRWYIEQFSWFLQKLDSMEDVDGRSVLDNSMIVYGCGNSDGNRHTHHNLPVLVGGGGGGQLITERYVQAGAVPMSNFLLSMADRMGVKGLERFGDSTGRLDTVWTS